MHGAFVFVKVLLGGKHKQHNQLPSLHCIYGVCFDKSVTSTLVSTLHFPRVSPTRESGEATTKATKAIEASLTCLTTNVTISGDYDCLPELSSVASECRFPCHLNSICTQAITL